MAAKPETATKVIDLSRNNQIAAKLRQAAELLAVTGARPFRVAAYRRAADTVQQLHLDVAQIEAAGGKQALDALPNIGPSIAAAIAELLHTGRWQFLERLRANTPPETLFRTIPGIGPKLARRLHEMTHADTLEALESGAHEGRLDQVSGVGSRRAAAIRNAIAGMLGRVRTRAPLDEPDIATLLELDREYRELAARKQLPQIAPKRFNPSGEAWLPVLRTRRNSWDVTALYSNTALAHDLGRTKDWVVIYFRMPGRDEMQRTVVTEHRQPLAGKRVVRGRESECLQYYEKTTAQAAAAPQRR
jgi:putative hydrolase